MTPDVEEKVRNLTRNFMPARIVLTAAELDLFTPLCEGAKTAKTMAAILDAELRGITILMDALAGMGYLEKNGQEYRCPESLAPYLSSVSETTFIPMLHHQARMWQRWSDLTQIVAPNSPPRLDLEVETEKAFIGAMHSIGAELAPKIVDAIKPGNARSVLDVAGGSGTYTIALLEGDSRRKATLFDLPHVIDMARERLEKEGLLDRVSLVPGNFENDPLPGGHDLALISAIIHQNSTTQNRDLYRKTFKALNPGGRLIIRDHIMAPDLTRPAPGAIFAVNMLVATQGGRCYSFEEIKSDLESCGFEKTREIQKDRHMDGLIEAFRPK